MESKASVDGSGWWEGYCTKDCDSDDDCSACCRSGLYRGTGYLASPPRRSCCRAGEQGPGAADTGGDLVGEQQDVVLTADLGHAPQIEATRDAEILNEWKRQPGLGPSQIRNQLRRAGVKVSVNTVPRVMEDAGYRPLKESQEPHDKRYESTRPIHRVE